MSPSLSRPLRAGVGRCLWVAFLCAALSLLPWAVYGDGMLLFLHDYTEQQIPFGIYMNRAIKSGNVFWAPGIDLGTNFIGAFSFYNLGSPFFWITLLFPALWYPYLMVGVYLLKYMAAALGAYLWLRRQLRQDRWALTGALLYAFCGYQSINLVFFHFHDVTALFPFLLLGLDLWVEEKRRWPFALAVFINLTTNYVFFVGQVLFLGLYYLLRWVLPQPRPGLRRLPGVVGLGLLGGAMAGGLLLPSVLFLLNNPRIQAGGARLFYSWHEYLFLLRSLLLPPSDMHVCDSIWSPNWNSCSFWLPLGGLALAAAYCLKAPKGCWLRRLLGLSLLFALFPLLNSLFMAGSADSYRRWFYMPSLFASPAAARVLEEPDRYPARGAALGGLALTAGTGLALAAGGQVYRPLLFGWNLALSCAGLAALLFLLRPKRPVRRGALALAGLFCVLSTTSAAGQYATDRPLTENYWEEVQALDQLTVPTGYRISSSENHRMVSAGLPNSGTFSSTVSGSIFEFYQALGLSRTVHSPAGDIPGVQNLLSAGYSIQMQAWEGCTADSEAHLGDASLYLYRDRVVPPIGFCYDTCITRAQLEELDPQQRGLAMLSALVVRQEDLPRLEGLLKPASLLPADLTTDSLDELVKLRSLWAARDQAYGRRSFSAFLEAPQPCCGFFSLPWDKGWRAYVNGQEVEIFNICGLMAVPLSTGGNQVTFRYTPPGLLPGLALSLLGFAAFGVLAAAEVRARRRAPERV